MSVAWQAAPPERAGVLMTGSSGLVVGQSPRGPITVRLFRNRPTRLVVQAPSYVPWLLAYRSISLGAHVSVITTAPQEWQGLIERIRSAGGTADLLDTRAAIPGAGRPYRPSLVVDDTPPGEGTPAQLGPWQALLSTAEAAEGHAVNALRAAELALISPTGPGPVEQLRRAYFLNQRQVRACALLAPDEVMLAMPRRLVKIGIRPTPLEYRLLFGE